MSDDLRTRIAAVLVGGLLGQAEQRGDYASHGFDPSDPSQERVHLDSSIDPFNLADVVIEELGLRQQVAGPDGIAYGKHRFVTDWIANE